MIASFPFLASSFDNDARTFINTSGATDRAAINHFVKGIKRLGLWSSMVCWPLRSTQNAGTGSTAYSLGGLGTYNGTLVNGPTWGADGIDFADNTTQHISTNFTPDSTNNFLIWSAFQCNAEGASLNGLCGSREGAASLNYFSCFQLVENQARAILWGNSGNHAVAGVSAITNGSYNTGLFRFDVTSSPKVAGVTLNEGAETTATTNDALGLPAPNFVIGTEQLNGAASRSLGGNLLFLTYIRLNSIDNSSLRSLYKSTLGQGLGLP
jgi:hypothetical protein